MLYVPIALDERAIGIRSFGRRQVGWGVAQAEPDALTSAHGNLLDPDRLDLVDAEGLLKMRNGMA